MRWDMFKVIVERPRKNAGWQKDDGTFERMNQPKYPVEGEVGRNLNIPLCEGMRRRWKVLGRSKFLNEHLGPLKRFLVRQAGRKWNDVFSEICKTLKLDSTVQRHVREHLEGYVAIKTALDSNGRLLSRHSWGRIDYIERTSFLLYVHPESGLLLRVERPGWKTISREKRAERKAAIVTWRRCVSYSAWIQYHKVGGVWYRCALRAFPRNGEKQWDCLLRCVASYAEDGKCQARYGRPGVFACEKKQASRHELKQLGIQNDPCDLKLRFVRPVSRK